MTGKLPSRTVLTATSFISGEMFSLVENNRARTWKAAARDDSVSVSVSTLALASDWPLTLCRRTVPSSLLQIPITYSRVQLLPTRAFRRISTHVPDGVLAFQETTALSKPPGGL